MLVCCVSVAVNGAWVQTNGPFGGGDVTALLMMEGHSYAKVGVSLYVSTDKGNHWVKKNFPAGATILKFYPDSQDAVIAVGRGIYRSTDRGDSWTSIGLTDENVYSWAHCGTYYFAATLSGVYRSVGSSGEWESSGLSDTRVWALAVNGETVFAATDSGLYKTENYGALWKEASKGMYVFAVDDINVFAVMGQTLYAGSNSHGIYRTFDNGKSWEDADTTRMSNKVYSMAVLDTTLIASIGTMLLTQKKGDSVLTKLRDRPDIRVLSVCDTQLFAGTRSGGIMRSLDCGHTWESVNNGIVATDIVCLGVSGGELYASPRLEKGICRSVDNGDTWTACNGGIADRIVYSFCVHDDDVFIGTDSRAVYQLSETGDEWVSRIPQNGNPITKITALAAHKNFVYAGGNDCDFGLFMSTDSGATFSYVDNTPQDVNDCDLIITSMTFLNSTLFFHAAGADVITCGLYSITPGDLSFNSVWMRRAFFNPASLVAIDGDVIFLDSEGKVGVVTEDSGMVLSTLVEQSPFPVILASDTNIFAYGFSSGINVSTDGGESWRQFNYGLPDSSNVTSLAVNETYLFAGTYFSGVWRRPLSEIPEATGVVRIRKGTCFNRELFTCTVSQSILRLHCFLAAPCRTTVNLYDFSGRLVCRSIDRVLPPGDNSMVISVASLTPGCYFVRLQSGRAVAVKKVTLM